MEAKIRPRLAAGDGPLKVPRQPAIASKPGEGPLDDPSPGQYLKTLGLFESLDQRPLPRPASAVSILDVGWVHLCANQMTAGIGNDVALAPVDLLPASYPRGPPLSVVWPTDTPADRLCCHRAPKPVGPAGI